MQSQSRQSQTSYTSVPIREMSAYYNNQHMNQYSPRGTSGRTSEYNVQFNEFRPNEYTPSQSRTPQSPSRMSSAYQQAMGVVYNMASKSPSRQSGYTGAKSPSRPTEYAATERRERRQQCYSPDGTQSRASRYSGAKSPSQQSESEFYTPLQKMALIRELESQILKSSKTSKKTSVENSFIAPKNKRRPEPLQVDPTKAPAFQDNFGRKIDQRARGEYSPLVKPEKPEPKTGIKAFAFCPPKANDENVRDHIKLAPPTVNLPKRNPIVQGDMPRSVRVRSTEQNPTYDYHLLNSRIHFLPSTREDRADKSPSYSKQLWNKTTMEHEKPKPVKTRIIPQNNSEGVKASLIYY